MRFFQMLIVFMTIISLFAGCTNTEKIEEEKRIAAEKAADAKSSGKNPILRMNGFLEIILRLRLDSWTMLSAEVFISAAQR